MPRRASSVQSSYPTKLFGSEQEPASEMDVGGSAWSPKLSQRTTGTSMCDGCSDAFGYVLDVTPDDKDLREADDNNHNNNNNNNNHNNNNNNELRGAGEDQVEVPIDGLSLSEIGASSASLDQDVFVESNGRALI
eukprot:CAMPEP_0206484658 /NCGR_PEP_ID=MMETSP0324_2-20121206/40098_1 /ASSEMBLY_ACC=CAM_ASM_000836 /TAXON_ID=2866 /ORGANISM="Crypthecodinium cohnii, Strain Seligo" /LENGTH=134 /DNA_ID=CAMNT_0053962833 /DNA_START=265 /DNA_END=669 /DNA_ORIENTATION=-